MNAGPDVERLISGWLREEAPGRAPDRVLEAAGRTIDRTRQRRFVAGWRESMFGLRGLAAAAAIAALVVAGAFYVTRPSLGPGDQPTPSITIEPTPTIASTGSGADPLKVGIYIGPTLQVADIVEALNADSTLTTPQRTRIIDELLLIRDKSTLVPSIELRGGQWTQREAVDGATAIIGSIARYSFPDDQTLEITETFGTEEVVTRFGLTIDGDSFRLRRLTPAVDAEDAFVVKVLFESGPFTLR